MHASRHYFQHETDKQDRIFQERKGADQLNTLKINPHRVQMFSINEIWQSMQSRLIQLNVLKDPEVESFASDEGESTEIEDATDFAQFAPNRIQFLFKGKKNQDKGVKSVEQLLRRNDLHLMKKLVEKVLEHDAQLGKNKETEVELLAQLNYLYG